MLARRPSRRPRTSLPLRPRVIASGFSQMMLLPAAAAASTISLCVLLGVQTVDVVDVIAFDQLPPVRFVGFVAPLIGKRLQLLFRLQGADRFQNRLVFEREEVADFAKGVGVRSAHKASTDDADVECFAMVLSFPNWLSWRSRTAGPDGREVP